MAFYGRANIAENTDFRFDRIYSNRAEMDANTSSDGIFLNRYILIEYDKEFEVSSSDKELYGEENYNKIVAILAEEGLTPHQKNSKIDSTIYQAVREYDSTVWMKTSIHTDDGNEKIKYVQIAELNSVVPTLNIKVVAPSLTAEQVSEQKNIGIEELPGFDKTNSTNITYDLYMQPIWDFTEDSEVLNIDTDVIEGHTSQDGEGIFVTLTTDDNIESKDLDINGKINKRFSFEFPVIGTMFTKLYTILYGGTGEYLTNPMNGTIMAINRDFQNIEANKIPGCLGAGRYVGFDFGFNTTDGVSFKTNDIAYSEETKEYKMQIDVEINSDGVFLGEEFAEKVSDTLKELLGTNDLTKQRLTDAIGALAAEYRNYQDRFVDLENAYNQLNWANENESFQMAISSNYLIDNNYQADLSKEEPIQPNDTLNTALAKLEGQIANNTIDQVFVINTLADWDKIKTKTELNNTILFLNYEGTLTIPNTIDFNYCTFYGNDLSCLSMSKSCQFNNCTVKNLSIEAPYLSLLKINRGYIDGVTFKIISDDSSTIASAIVQFIDSQLYNSTIELSGFIHNYTNQVVFKNCICNQIKFTNSPYNNSIPNNTTRIQIENSQMLNCSFPEFWDPIELLAFYIFDSTIENSKLYLANITFDINGSSKFINNIVTIVEIADEKDIKEEIDTDRIVRGRISLGRKAIANDYIYVENCKFILNSPQINLQLTNTKITTSSFYLFNNPGIQSSTLFTNHFSDCYFKTYNTINKFGCENEMISNKTTYLNCYFDFDGATNTDKAYLMKINYDTATFFGCHGRVCLYPIETTIPQQIELLKNCNDFYYLTINDVVQ